MRGVRLVYVSILFFFSAGMALAADVKIGKTEYGQDSIFITGEIRKGDFEKVVDASRKFVKELMLADSNSTLHYVLDSAGGDVEESIRIGRLFRETLASISVLGRRIMHESEGEARWAQDELSSNGKGANLARSFIIYSESRPLKKEDLIKCYSACVLILIGGIHKEVIDNHFWINDRKADEQRDIPVMGLHRPFYDQERYAKLSLSEARIAYKELEDLVRSYLIDAGASQEMIDRMFRSSSNEVDLVNAKAFNWMIDTEVPFYNEWILAKCGSSDGGQNILSADDFSYVSKVWSAKKQEIHRLRAVGKSVDRAYIYLEYMPKDMSKERYDRIMKIVQSHNRSVSQCSDSATREHQIAYYLAEAR
jgi:hypothetical protein